MNFEQIKALLFEAAAAQGLMQYDVYYRTTADESAQALNREPSSCSSGLIGGVCFRCAVNGRIGSAATQCFTKEELEALVQRAVANAAVMDADEEPIFFRGSDAAAYRAVDTKPPELPGVALLRRTAMELQEKLYAQSDMMTDGTTTEAGATRVTVALANSNGLCLSRDAGAVYTYVEPILSDGNEPSFGSAFAPTLSTDTDIVQKATDEAIARLGAGELKTGVYDVIFDARQMRTMLSAFAGIFSGKNALQGLSLLKGREGEQIAAPCFTLIDDPFYDENPMQCAFDAEGVPTREKVLVDRGVLQTLLYDLTNARKAGVAPTGNASRGYADPVSIAPYCLRILPGKESREELLCRMGEGLYITELKGLHAGADAVTGDFSIESAGFVVKGGKITRPVHSFTVAGNFFTLLKQIDGVASNVQMGVPATTVMAAPDVLVRGLDVAGE